MPLKSRDIPDPGEFWFVLSRALAPFLVTRQIFCGAGKIGFDFRDHCEMTGYQISQRTTSSNASRAVIRPRIAPSCT